MFTINSLQNPKIKQIIRLRDRREREQTGLFLVEGYRELVRAVQAGVEISTLYTCPEFFLGGNEEALLAQVGNTIACSATVFKKISYRDRPDGLLAVAKQQKRTLDAFTKGSPAFFLVCEAIEKPGNLGTILRSCDATGVDGVIVCDPCTDIYNPNTVRASVGTLFTVPVVQTSSLLAIEWLQQNQIAILAATPSGTKEFEQVDMRGDIALVVGAEQVGLSRQWLEVAQERVSIAMQGAADSLNVAMAATVLLFEAVKQRKRRK